MIDYAIRRTARNHLLNILKYYNAMQLIKYKDDYVENFMFEDINENLEDVLSNPIFIDSFVKTCENFQPTMEHTIRFLKTRIGKQFFSEFLGDDLVNQLIDDLSTKGHHLMTFEERYSRKQ